MFITIQAHQADQYKDVLKATFKLRKKVFIDELDWDIPAQGEYETDSYDNASATYLVWLNPVSMTVYGSLRLISTLDPTLLHDVFHATHGCDPTLIDPQVFEGTRMCIDSEAIARDFPDLNPNRSMQLMLLALCETALAHGVKRLVSNFEAPLSRIYRAAGLKYKLHGQADGYGRKPVYCASFEVTKAVLQKMRETIGVELPVFRLSVDAEPMAPVLPAEFAVEQRELAVG